MDVNPEVCPPIIVVGTKALYLHAAETVEEAVGHACNRFGTTDLARLNDLVDLFDVAGRRLNPNGKSGRSNDLVTTDSKDYGDDVREHVRGVIKRKIRVDGRARAMLYQVDRTKSLEDLGQTLAELLRETEGPASVESALATPNNNGSWMHNTFCH